MKRHATLRPLFLRESQQGKTSVQTLGFSGPSCREASKFLEQALGQRVQETLTAEFHQTEPVQQINQQQSC